MKFEWDEDKNEENIRKHGFDFADVSVIFDGPMLVDTDTREDYGEDRWIVTGLVQNRVMVVIFTDALTTLSASFLLERR